MRLACNASPVRTLTIQQRQSAVATAERLRQFRRQQRRRTIMRRDVGAKATRIFQNTPMIHSAREPNHQSRHERIARADRVFHFDLRRGCSR